MKYDYVFGLGRECELSYNLKRITPFKASLPFDWLITPFGALIQVIKNDFANFIDKDNLVLKTFDEQVANHIADTRNGIRFHHDFEISNEFMKNFDQIRAKYGRRIERWRNLLSANGRVLFIRHAQSAEDALNDKSSTELLSVLAKAYPRVEVHVLVINNPLAGILTKRGNYLTIRSIRPPEPFSWTGDPAAWDEIIRQELFV